MAKLPFIKPQSFQFTREGFENLKKELADLVGERPGVLKRMVEAREQGDLSENAGYHAAKDRLAHIDSRVRELKLLIRTAEIIEDNNTDTIGLGSKVVVGGDSGEQVFNIVGQFEADPKEGKVSDISPIGNALVGKKAGETVTIEIPDGKIVFRILKVN